MRYDIISILLLSPNTGVVQRLIGRSTLHGSGCGSGGSRSVRCELAPDWCAARSAAVQAGTLGMLEEANAGAAGGNRGARMLGEPASLVAAAMRASSPASAAAPAFSEVPPSSESATTHPQAASSTCSHPCVVCCTVLLCCVC
jgi:hypothetical protein